MHERTDISQDIKNIIDDFYFGFSYISLGISWEDLNMSTEAQNSFDDAAEMLESAIEAYDIFL
jgi:hypothetical protein